MRKVFEVYLIGAHTHKSTGLYKRNTFASRYKHGGIKSIEIKTHKLSRCILRDRISWK